MEIHRKFLCSKANPEEAPKSLNSSDDETYIRTAKDDRVVYICGCSKRFSTKGLLKKHQATGDVEDEWVMDESTDEDGCVVFKCECKDVFSERIDLDRHRRKGKCREYSKIEENYDVRRDAFGRNVYSCRSCRRTFCRKNHLLKHRSNGKCKSDARSRSSYSCDDCGGTFQKKKLLLVHRRKHHVEVFKCEHCSKVFANVTTLRNHKKLVHEDGRANFACEYCAMRFLGESALAKHIRKHTNERPFKCNICDKAFVVERSLKIHVDFAHMGGKKNFICDVCGVTFARKEYLHAHAHVHSKDRRFRCEHCSASFRWNAAKRKHLFVKHQDKLNLFKCRYCGRKFKLEKNCEAHESQHEKN